MAVVIDEGSEVGRGGLSLEMPPLWDELQDYRFLVEDWTPPH